MSDPQQQDIQSSFSSELPAQWKSSAIPLNRREQVHRYVGIIPYPSNQTSAFLLILTCHRNRKYQLIIMEQPQQCRMSGFGEKDRRPIDPAPIIQLMIYDENDQPIDLKECPLCVLHASLWSKDHLEPLDTVQTVRQNLSFPSSSTLISSSSCFTASSNQVRAMTGSLSSSPSLLRNQEQELGIYFSFPDLSVRVANTYSLRFDLVILSDSCQTATSVAYIYSNPFIVYSTKDFPGVKESSELAKTLSKQGLKVSVKHSIRPKKKDTLSLE
ncbi:velvet factor-domain-containing protein [Halteromyces radiatus]|uniref:velvet factor-domain-containing protein n=1 Tax=Halteromyces radiatus TaxID=101107 RepID=UPI00221EEB46|nr:velvet factor-domain-containing protein [Halteromyces radiatus]KAI8096438.1 velvet factor-domain-containing protein [Halteromyces radiatus]